jgi:hypothetical protein
MAKEKKDYNKVIFEMIREIPQCCIEKYRFIHLNNSYDYEINKKLFECKGFIFVDCDKLDYDSFIIYDERLI